MRLSTLRDALRTDACSRRHAATWAARTGPLLAYDGPAAVFEAMRDQSESNYPEREALTRAMLEGHRAGAPLWGSMLLVAYYPMLSRLRRRIISDTVARDDLDQLVVASFQSALSDVQAGADRLALRLRRRTQRLVFRFIQREREHHDRRSTWEKDVAITVVAHPEPVLRRRANMPALLVAANVAHDVADAILHTSYAEFGDRSLRGYIARTYGGTAEQQERRYQNLKRRRTRALKRMRALDLTRPEFCDVDDRLDEH